MNEEQMSTEENAEVVEEASIVWTEQGAPEEVVRERKMAWMEQEISEEAGESWSEPLLGGEEIEELQSRWNSIQKDFVDAPLTSVERADALAAETMEKIARMSAETRASLIELWEDHEDISTEDLRIALQRYRSFFNRLLNR